MIDKLNCAARLIFAFFPLLRVALNFVLTPSNAIVSVCDVPAAPLVRSIAVPAAAFEELVASLILF